jgi:hypothetical protein
MTMNPTTHDQGDERRAMTAAYMAFCADKAPDHNEVGFPYFKAAWQARAAQPVAQEAIPPIERDESMDRTYIPLPGGWEVQTQGKGSTFRICNTKTGKRWPVLDKMLHTALEQMARDANASALAAPQPSQGIDYHAPERIKAWNNAAPHPPVSADAGKGVDSGYICAQCKAPLRPGWTCDACGSEEAEDAPSESVAVSGEVSERVAKCSAILTLIDNYAPEKLGTAERTHLAVAVDAVLALAGSAKQAAALERMARLDDEMGIEP